MTGKQVLILGLGKTGLSCAKHYHRQGDDVSVMDSRANPPCLQALQQACPQVPVITGGFDIARALQAKQIVVSPGIGYHEPVIQKALQAGINVIGDIEVFAQHVTAPVAAVTGTNGKSTVTRMLTQIINNNHQLAYEGGNFGTPALDLLNEPTPHAFVLELSSFQLLNTFSLHPKVACIVNISPDHLDWHKDFNEYLQAKLRIYRHCDIAVVNIDDPRLATAVPKGTSTLSFSTTQDADFCVRIQAGKKVLWHAGQVILPVDELPLFGRYNWENALAASAMATAMHVPMDVIAQTLRTFHGLDHRCQRVTENAGVTWFNDSKGTNVGATLAVIESFLQQGVNIVLIAGGLAKGGEFAPLADALSQGKCRGVVLFGADAKKIQLALNDTLPIAMVHDLEQAVQQAQQWARPGDVVLFSPACASFDMFDNYRHRGECFVQAVRKVVDGR